MSRPVFSSRFGTLVTMIGVAVGLGNVWRFPYMTGQFGGASFVLVYVLMVVLLGIPALMAEWSLGRSTGRGPVGAFEKAGLPGGRWIGWGLFAGVTAATAYYTNAIGWVLYHALGQLLAIVGVGLETSAILPPETGFSTRSMVLQMLCTGGVILAAAWILKRGLRSGIEKASSILMPLLAICLLIVIGRGLTLDGSWAGVEWYLLKIERPTLGAVLAAMGQAFFSLSLGGTFMVVYGSYLQRDEDLLGNASWTAAGDLGAGILAGLAILPAVFALALEPGSGPGLIFATLPQVFEQIPGGPLFGSLFFIGLLGAAFLSDVGAFEVLVAGLCDELEWTRDRAIHVLSVVVFLIALPPMINLQIFIPWDLTFGSGLQTLGAAVAAVTVGWCLDRRLLAQQLAGGSSRRSRLLLFWLRWVVPTLVLGLGLLWLLTDVLGLTLPWS